MRTRLRRLFSLALVLALAAGLVLPAGAAGSSDTRIPLTLEEAGPDAVTAEPVLKGMLDLDSETALLSSTDSSGDEMVRVSIVLEDASTLEAGYEAAGIAENTGAVRYRASLRQEQAQLQTSIERQALNGRQMDVVWNLTLAANMISANVPRSAIAKIAAMDGVKAVVEETRYSPDVVSIGGDYTPSMAVSSQMTGASAAWLEGYTGAGTRIAVIDTGLDTDHQSFDEAAFSYAVEEDAANAGRTVESYNLLDAAEITEHLSQLNAYKQDETLTGEALYINSKAPFGYNYVDGSTEITHDQDSQGEHGSHVAGIAAANRYVKQNGAFADAMESVHVAGNAPDAQILVMKVFGQQGGAFDSDIMAAIEDAIVLGADSVNLSLGSGSAGMAVCPESEYQRIMESLVESGTVTVMSAGNSGYWAENAYTEDLYADGGVNFDTAGSPGSYTNAFTVASVDNQGLISATLKVGSQSICYSEATTSSVGMPYSNVPLDTLDTSADKSGTEYAFVLVDGVGEAANYEGIDLTGKIVFCQRGAIDFGEKGNAAASRGAAATVVYNNEAGLLSMDLYSYHYTAPVVFISQADGAAVKDSAERQTTEDGLTYYTGKITVVGKVTGNYIDSEYLTMSEFSSWGVPGDLSLKPEIAAPGGNIFSVNGGVAATDQYELMSGTSMAAPQVTGMSALVQQYLKENGIEAPGMTSRALTQSLLMSTAAPMRSAESAGSYYPVLQQGAGLADVRSAIKTPTYVTVDGQPDGKVKAELGDDPDRAGTYTVRFSLHNLTDAEYAYQLSGEVFTQDTYVGTDGSRYLSTNTRLMDASVDFMVNGVSVMEPDPALAHCDFNGDGLVNRADAQLLLDHVTTGTTLKANAQYADISGDGAVTTYDVHLFLNLYQGLVSVPANGAVTVQAVITLTDGEKAKLKEENPTGAYVEAFLCAAPMATEDGELLPVHSIPVLGYYGNWSDPSMFDVGEYVTYATEDETRTPYIGATDVNAVGIVYGDREGSVYYFGGNPVVPDETYLPERNAINLARGDYFYAWQFGQIRNAAASRFTAVNTTTGQELCAAKYFGAMEAAYYYTYYSTWMNVPKTATIKLHPQMNVGEYGLLTLTLAPELYVDRDGNVDWDSLGQGVSMEMPFTVDNETPTISKVVVNTEKNVLEVTAHDDQYLAGVLLYDNTGRKLLSRVGTTADAKQDAEITFEIPLEDVDGYRFVIQVADYAANFATYRLKETIGDPDPLPSLVAYNSVSKEWQSFSMGVNSYGRPTLNWNTWSYTGITPSAAASVGEYAFICDDAGYLYVAPADDLMDTNLICNLGYVFTDMTYSAAHDLLYGVTAESLMVSVDKLTGEATELGTIGGEAGFTNTLTCDRKGTFYCNKLKTYEIYSFTLGQLDTPTFAFKIESGYSWYETRNQQTMAYDAARNTLCWVARNGSSYGGSDNLDYFEYNLETGKEQKGSFMHPMFAMITPEWGVESSWADPVYVAERVLFESENVEVLLGCTGQVKASALPWNLVDKSVTYTSSDPGIASVDAKGVVTGVSAGTTTIRAASSRSPDVYAECTVTVRALDVTAEGILMNDQGDSLFYTWNMSNGQGSWRSGAKVNVNGYTKAAAEIPGENAFYHITSSNVMTKRDLQTGEMLSEESKTYDYALKDIAYSEFFSDEGAPRIYAINKGGSVMQPHDPMNPGYGTMSLSYAYNTKLVALAVGGTENVVIDQGIWSNPIETDAEIVYVLDASGDVYRLDVYKQDYGYGSFSYKCGYSVKPSTLKTSIEGEGYSSMVVGSDGALYVSVFTGMDRSVSELYRMVYDEGTDTYVATYLGNFGTDVWPATLLHVSSNEAAVTAYPAATVWADLSETESTPVGSLNAVQIADRETAGSTGYQVVCDVQARTVTVPVLASDSTNGLFTLDYDAELLTLQSVRYGSVLHSGAEAAGSVTVGYADAEAVNGLVAEMTFQYKPAFTSQKTALNLLVKEDGQTGGDASTIEVTLKGIDLAVSRPITSPVVGSDKAEQTRFKDVSKSDWYYDAVMEIAERGLMNGVSDSIFAPNAGLTRGMLVTTLWRVDGSPKPGSSGGFTDVAAGSWYEAAVNWAAEKGIVDGYGGGRFGPEDPITRQQLAAILWRYAQYKGYDVRANGTVIPDFEDRNQIEAWAGEAVSWAYSRGIMTGKGEKRLDPTGGATRAEAAAMLLRFLNLPTGGSGHVKQ